MDNRNKESAKDNRSTDSCDEKKLPITAEVGGEGGSFADATNDVATECGDIDRVSRHDVVHKPDPE